MKYLIILIPTLLIIAYYIFPPIIKKICKEKLEVNNEFGILNNKYVINFKDIKISAIDTLKIAIHKTTGNIAIIDLKIYIFTENTKLHITDFKHSMKILAYMKKYNLDNFNQFINKFFYKNAQLKSLFEKELENENTWS